MAGSKIYLIGIVCLFGIIISMAAASFYYNANIKYFSYTDNGSSITITGHNGFIETSIHKWSSIPKNSCLRDVVIPSSINGKQVTSIGKNAFANCVLHSVSIPSSVTSIMWSAFYGCTQLNSVTIPASVTSVEGIAFYNCTGLCSVSFKGNAPTNFGNHVFDNVSRNFIIRYPSGASGWTTPTWKGYPTKPY